MRKKRERNDLNGESIKKLELKMDTNWGMKGDKIEQKTHVNDFGRVG